MRDFYLTKLIEKKRKGGVFSNGDIKYFVDAVVKTTLEDAKKNKECPDRAQIGAMLMAIYWKGLTPDETTTLTMAMKESGYVFTWPKTWNVVDKHSTGGVGDKISIVLAPILAAIGLKVPMISGRSLMHTGGTLDKLESIPGFRVYLTKDEIYNIIEMVGCCIVGQTNDCVPADKVLYQCREITSTVDCNSLITASIVSKKLSEGTDVLIYDVKFGKGSIFKSKEDAKETAKNLIQTSKGIKASALLTSMENPLGRTIGNSLEVLEAVQCLQGKGPSDVMELTFALGCEALRQVSLLSEAEGRLKISAAVSNGSALKAFHDMLIQQGVKAENAQELCYGNPSAVLPSTRYQTFINYVGENGYIHSIDPLALALVWKDELHRSNQHPGVGFHLLATVGDQITKGEAWLRFYHESEEILKDEVKQQLQNAIEIRNEEKEKAVLVDMIIRHTDVKL